MKYFFENFLQITYKLRTNKANFVLTFIGGLIVELA